MVHLLVGHEAIQFDVHRRLLCSASVIFEKAFNGEWRESEGKMSLPKVDPFILQLLVHTLYTGKIDFVNTAVTHLPKMVPNHLCLYTLADRLQFRQILPLLMDCIRSQRRFYLSIIKSSEAEYIYSNSEQSSKLRRLAAESIAHTLCNNPFMDSMVSPVLESSPELASDVCKILRDACNAGKKIEDPLV